MARCGFVYFLLLLPLLELEANPSDPTVVSGQAACISTPEKLEITAHDKTIISWKDFSIGSKETTRFNLPNSRSVILNRVGSHNPSKIEGLLSSNGIVYLLNKNGILITPSGKIETAGFLASTLDISDQDFLSGGDILFTGSSGSITNLGAIQCSSGDVILIASQLKNDGTIEAPDGKIALGAAQEILMTLQGEERLTVRLSTPDSKEEVGIRQTGTLKALQAELKADGNLFAYAIKNEGHIHAATAVRKDGRIYLVAEKGLVASSGTLTAPGGEVRMLGQIASLTDQAQIDVSHDTGGGTVLIGGDYQGKNPGIFNAQMTYVGPDVVISAAALQSGQGGKVIAWADGETFFYGKINAPGGPLAGDGGFAEVSGKHNLDFLGLVDLSAPQGKTGMLLLDPTNVTFSTAADSGFAVIPPTCLSGYGLSGAPATANVNIANLLTNLGTCSVTISTAVATGSVTLSSGSPLNWTGTTTNTLTVNATSTLTFSDALTNSTTGGSMTWTGTTVSIAGPITNSSTSGNITITGTGAVTQTAAGTITNTSTSGALNISGSTVTLTSAAIQNGPLTGATAANPTISIMGSAGGSFGAAAVPMTSNTAAGGGITLSGFTTFNINGPVTNGPTSGGPSGAGTISMFCSGAFTQAVGAPILNNSATGGITLDSTANVISLNGTLTSNSSGLTTLTAGVNIGTNSITFNAGSLVMTVGGKIQTNGLISFAAGAGSLTLKGGAVVDIEAGITFASTAGSMIIVVPGNAAGFSIYFNAPLVFNSPNSCTLISEAPGGGYIYTTSLGTMTFNAGSLMMLAENYILSINAPISFPNTGAGSLTMVSPLDILISAGITFNSTGSLVINATQEECSITAPVIFNSPGSGLITSTALTGGGGISSTSAGTISIGAGAGPFTIRALTSSIGLGGAVTNNSGSLLTIDSGSSTTFGALLTNNSTATGTSLFVNAGNSISFNATGGFTSSSPGASVFIGNAINTASFSTTPTSTFSTSGTGNVSIIGTSAVNLSAISIPGPLTLGSSGAFSATALSGTVNINGSISSTAGGAFTVSAPNAATAVTINGTSPATSSFAAGSIVNISSNGNTGGITLGSSTANGMTFAAGAGSLTVSSTGPININGPLSYSYTGPCQFLGTGASGSIANNASGAMTFFSGCGDATFQSTNSTVTFNATSLIQFQSGAGNAFVTTNPGTGSNMTIGLFDFESGPGKAATFNSNAALTFGANFTYGTSSGTCNMTSFGLLTYGPGTLALNTSALNMTSTAGGITTTAGTGLITINALAGALTMNAFGTITIGAALANNSSTSPLTMLATSPSGNIAINGAITTSGNGNVNATAGVNITLGAGITYTQAVGTGTFIAGQADSLGLFSTTATSPLGTSGSGILSITSANAAGSAAITIAGALTLASSGSFSATATTGNAAITGAITTSGGGAFSASALGPAGTVTLSTAATNSFTGSAVSLMAGTGGVTLSTTNTTFAAGAGSLTVNSVGPVAINTALTYASTGSCQFISTGGSITSNASGIMNFNAGSGAASFTANTIAGQAITIGAAITNSSANSLTTTSSGTTTFNALLTNNSTLSATPSLIVNAGENIAFGASPAGFTSGSPGASNFTANTAALGSFSTVAGSSLATTSTAGAVSITAANATGANAISILCPITLASSGSFSATATTGNVLMSGTITNTTASGVFNVSAPGESGAITLSNTIDFNPGSAVTLASAGLTTLSGAAMTFGAGAGSFLTVGTLIAPVGSIAINGTLNYSSPGVCQFIASGSITNSAAGIMNFSGGPVTFESTASTITFNATPAITFNSGAGALSVSTIGGGAITLGGPFVFNAGSSSTASFNASGPLSVNGTFTYNVSSGTCSLLSTGLLTLNNTLNLNAGSLSMQSTSSGITTTASGPITVAAAAGPLTMQALNTLTLGGTLNDLSSTLLTMTTTSTIGDILINAALTTSGNATLSAARNLTFGAAIPYTQSAGTGNLLAGQAAEGLFSISSLLSTSGSAALSITSSNAPASNAISIRAVTLSSTGAFSATATQGIVSISGNISSTAGAPFSVSAPGTAGAIIISSPTVSFTPGSVVNLAAAGNTSLSGTSTFGSGGSGSLAISGNTAGVSISGPLTYDSTGAFQISSTGSTIRTTPAGTITVNAGTGLTMTANGLITIGGTVLYNSSDVNGFTAASSAGGITITAPITVTTAAPLAFSATTAGQQVLIQNQVLNSSTGPITVTTSNLTLEPVAGSTTSAELGTLSGALALTNVTQVALIGGTAAGAFAQLGYNPTGASSNITFTNCHSLSLEPGTASNCYTLLGHGSPSSASTVTGNITISGTGNLTMGTSGNGTNCFSQIGHVQSSAGTTASGDIAVTLGGSISMTGGDNTNTYALIGHGGGPSGSTNSYTGNVAVQAGGDIVLRTNSSGTNAFAAIGPAALSTGTVTITGDATPVISAASTGGSIVLQSAPNNECVIGAYIRGGSSNTINPFTISVAAGQDLILTGAPNPGAALNGALIGALAYTGSVPFAASGTSTSTLNITVGRNLEMQTSSGPANALTFTAIQNGLGGASNPITVNVTGAASLLGGNNISTITSLGALTLTAAGDVTVLSDQTTGSAGAATIQGSGNTSVSGSGVTVTGYIGGPEALIQTAAGNLSVSSHFMTLASNGNILLTAGAGTLTVNAAVGDLNLNDLASIQNQGSGPTLMTVGGTVGLTAGAGNAMIAGNTGTLTMTIIGNLNLITNTGGSASITSNGAISATAQNIALSGLGAGQQSLIQTTMGDLLLMAMNDITLDDNALIANAGSGNVTLVADQQAPLPPLIGPGRFILNPNAAITAMGGALLQVFTARPNGITAGNLAFGQLNGNYVTTGFVCPFDRPIPSAENQYDTYYDLFLLGGADPAALGAGTTYTIFYKVPFIPPTPPVPPTPTPVPVVPTPVLQRNLGKIIYASSQIFWVLREYPVYRSDETAFFLNCKICRKRSRKFGKFCMDVDDRYPYIHQNWTRYPIGL